MNTKLRISIRRTEILTFINYRMLTGNVLHPESFILGRTEWSICVISF